MHPNKEFLLAFEGEFLLSCGEGSTQRHPSQHVFAHQLWSFRNAGQRCTSGAKTRENGQAKVVTCKRGRLRTPMEATTAWTAAPLVVTEVSDSAPCPPPRYIEMYGNAVPRTPKRISSTNPCSYSFLCLSFQTNSLIPSVDWIILVMNPCMWPYTYVFCYLSNNFSCSLTLNRAVISFPMSNVHFNEGENPWLPKVACGVVTIDLHVGSHFNGTLEVDVANF